MTELSDVKPVKPQLNLSALTAEMAAKMLGLPADIVRKHIEQGMPTAADGTINLVHYGAWLCNRLQSSDISPQVGKCGLLLKTEDWRLRTGSRTER